VDPDAIQANMASGASCSHCCNTNEGRLHRDHDAGLTRPLLWGPGMNGGGVNDQEGAL
jgi:hypothetical protein